MKLWSQNKNTHIFGAFIVYSHFEMPVFGRHTKSSSWESPECIGVFHIQTKKPEDPIELG